MNLTQAIHQTNFQGLNLRKQRYKRLEKAVERIERKAEGLEIPDIDSFDFDEAISHLAKGDANRRDIKRIAAGGLSLMEQREDGNELLAALLSAVESLGRGLLKSLLIGYLISRNNESWVLERVRQFLWERQDALPSVWRVRVKEYRLLSKDVGEFCAGKILTSDDFDPLHFAGDSGLRGVKGAGGVGYKVFQSLSNELAGGHTDENFERYLKFVSVDDGIRFPSHINDYANALLSPYVEYHAHDDDRAVIEQFFLDHFGDPRIEPGIWKEVPEGLVDVMKQWLAKASLELLLNVVNASNDTEQWEQRYEFWSHYFDQGLVSDAWVALGPAAAMEARRLVRSGEIASAADYGVLEGGGVQSDHSVLMFKLGDFVITEWTHSGKVRVYDERNRNAPRFYDRTYNTQNIRSDTTCNVAVIHHTRWRERVSGFLEFETSFAPPRGISPLTETRSCASCRHQLQVLWFPDEYARSCSRCMLKSTYV
jgi:EH_Signature domain